MPEEESPELAALREAVQAMANAGEDNAHMVTSAVVVWEAITYDDDGQQMHAVQYSCPTDTLSVVATLGLLDAATHMVRRDALGTCDCSDDD